MSRSGHRYTDESRTRVPRRDTDTRDVGRARVRVGDDRGGRGTPRVEPAEGRRPRSRIGSDPGKRYLFTSRLSYLGKQCDTHQLIYCTRHGCERDNAKFLTLLFLIKVPTKD